MKVNLSIYPGYANEREIIVFGHLFKKPFGNLTINARALKQARAIVKLFMPSTLANVELKFQFQDMVATTRTLDDGYFRFSIPIKKQIDCGWHRFHISTNIEGDSYSDEGVFVKPYPGEYGMISDIDDTFLISHSGNIFKKLYVMLSRNVERRKVFKGVVNHYRSLYYAGRKDKSEGNAFFYVSSSEWNLFPLIDQFTALHKFPKAVIKLRKIKNKLFDLIFSGGGNHEHKFHKIKHIIEFYPTLKFVLLGDDSQQDPYIFEKIAKIFPKNLFAIYIRQTKNHQRSKVKEVLQIMEQMYIHSCYFVESSEAMEHSKKIGLIKPN